MAEADFHLRYLLDTNILSNLVQYPQGVVARRIAEVGAETVATSVIVACELQFGAVKRGSDKLSRNVSAILSNITILELDESVVPAYASIRWALEQSGRMIGPNDLLIAAHAFALGLVMVTANDDEFHRVPGLTVENWLG